MKKSLFAGLLLSSLALASVGCGSEVDSTADGAQAERAYIDASVELRPFYGQSDDSASYRSAVNAPSSGDVEIRFYEADEPDVLVLTERIEGAPFNLQELRIPAELQGWYYISATISGSDGSTYTTPDQLRGPDGEPLYPDIERVAVKLEFGRATNLQFVFFEQLDFGDGTVDLNPVFDAKIFVNEEQWDLWVYGRDPSAQARLSGCLAFDGSITRSISMDVNDAYFVWADLSEINPLLFSPILIVGQGCKLDLEIFEEGNPRFQGSVDFIAPPGDGRTVPLEMPMRLVDAYLDVSFDVQGTAAEGHFGLSDELMDYLDLSTWQNGLSYHLSAVNSTGDELSTELTRDGSSLWGMLAPIDESNRDYSLTLEIRDGTQTVLSGTGSALFFDGAVVNFIMSYELHLEVTAKNLTSFYFNAWLSDVPDRTTGVEVHLDFETPEGISMSKACMTGTNAAYSCVMDVPTGSTGLATYSFAGYGDEVMAINAQSMQTVNLPYVSLDPATARANAGTGPSVSAMAPGN